MTAISLLLAIAAFALFGLATDKHHQRQFRQRPTGRRAMRMRGAAWAMIAAAFASAVAAQGWIFGPILWAGTIMLGAGVAFVCLNVRPTPDR